MNNFSKFKNKKLNLKVINSFIKKIKHLNILIVGETIIDIFQTVELDGQSTKSHCPTFIKKKKIQQFNGGALYIKNHILNFCKKVTFITNDNNIIKLRYIDVYNNKKHFEIKKEQIKPKKHILKNENYDLILIADFGHGFLDKWKLLDNIYLMCQTNSSNFGYNKVTKWNKYKAQLVVLDKIEASLILNKKITTINKSIIKQLYNKLNTHKLILTMSVEGSIYYDKNNYYKFPAITTNIKDAIGAGDTFFAFASLASYLDFKPTEILMIASISAFINTQYLCTEKIITPKDLIKVIKTIL